MPRDRLTGSLQSYTIACKQLNQGLASGPGRLQLRSRHCQDTEICVDGHHGPPGYTRPVATCVGTMYFVRMLERGNNGPLSDIFATGKSELEGFRNLEGLTASMMLSQSDKKTPLEVGAFHAKAGGAPDGTAVQEGQCKDCLDLETARFAKGTNSLEFDATILTAGALSGILWLSLMGVG